MSAPIRGYTTISTIVFTLVALFQVWRALAGFSVEINHNQLPVAASWGLAAVAAVLAVWGWRSR
jgi:hypothetical protein